MQMIFSELDLLIGKKITPIRANAAARLALAITAAADLEVVHHRLKPARGNVVRPVTLVRQTAIEVPALEDKTKKRRK